jgi:hypothetical protein
MGGTVRHTPGPVSLGKREGGQGTPDALLGSMRLALAVGLVTVATMLAAAAGCSTSSAGAGAADGSVEAATVVADAQSDAPIACTGRYDCSPLYSLESTNQSSPVPCCTDGVCGLEPSDYCTDANVQLIQASNYQQSCTVDTDCVAVGEGNFCNPGSTNCSNAAISKSDYAQYQADVAKTNGASCYAPGNCGGESGPCCIGGKCQMNAACFNAVPAGDAAADTGADAAAADAGADAAMDGGTADADACAPSGGCTAACVAGRHNVTIMVDGCLVTQCCVLDDAGAD